jgi:hypothetical protein
MYLQLKLSKMYKFHIMLLCVVNQVLVLRRSLDWIQI